MVRSRPRLWFAATALRLVRVLSLNRSNYRWNLDLQDLHLRRRKIHMRPKDGESLRSSLFRPNFTHPVYSGSPIGSASFVHRARLAARLEGCATLLIHNKVRTLNRKRPGTLCLKTTRGDFLPAQHNTQGIWHVAFRET